MATNEDRGALISLDSFLPYRLSVASNAASNFIARAYRERFGLTIAEWRLVAILAERTRATPQDLVGLTHMDKIAVSRIAKKLQHRGLLACEPNLDDRRSHFLRLTSNGHALYRKVAPVALELENRLLRELSPEDRAQLEILLRGIEESALSAGRPVEATGLDGHD